MGLRFLADHCVSNSVMQALRNAGYEIHRLRDVLPVESPDAIVISKAQDIDAILLSLNGDFADLATYPPQEYKGIIALQLRNHPEVLPQLVARLASHLRLHPDMDYYRGKLFVVEVDRIRIRS
jgi:predicted nuclease of predicted toxin-antitoxin system